MARGTQHRKRRPRPNARAAVVASPARAAKHAHRKPPQWQEQLFFARLRNHAKWLYLVLAVAFALTFAFLGVGSGSTGISGALQNFFSFGGSSGTSTKGLLDKVNEHPQDAADWRSLATAYETDHETAQAIVALERYTVLKPKDSSALQELAAQYTSLAQTDETQAENAETLAQTANTGTSFAPPSTTPFGKAFGDTNSLGDPLATSVATTETSIANTAFEDVAQLEQKAEGAYQKLAKLTPNDASIQVELGEAAESANDTATAIVAFRKFLKLAPDDPLAPQVRSALSQLAPTKKK